MSVESDALKEKAAALGNKHLKAVAHDINNELIPVALDLVKAKINGPVDDVIIEAIKPALKATLSELIEKI